ncbi:translation initiation factor IF-6 [Halorutilales archaeon Cl-col2-1]
MLRAEFNGSPFLGVFGVTTDRSLLVTSEIDESRAEEVADELGVENVYTGTINGSSVLGTMAEGNTEGIAVSSNALDREIREIRDITGVNVERISGRHTAVGNTVLANDNAALVSPELSEDAKDEIAGVLGVEVHEGTVAGLDTVGSAGVATDEGVLVHPKSNDDEVEYLEDVFEVPVDIGTVNYGTPLVGSGLIANSKGYVVGAETTGPELGRIEEALGFIDEDS